MKKKNAKLTAWLMIAAIGFSCFPPSAFATEEAQSISYVPDEYVVITEYGPDNDELFAQYVDREFGIEETASDEQEASNYAVRASGKVALSGVNKIVYDKLSEGIADIANGSRESAVFMITAEELGIDGNYSASDLGVSSTVVDGSIDKDASAAMYGMIDLDYRMIIDLLLFDMPYDLYWYDKTVGIRLQAPSIAANHTDGEWKLAFKGDYTVKMAVSVDYMGSYDAGDYKVDTGLTGATSAAVAKAESVIEANKTKLDYDKLVAYRDFICNEVSFYSAGSTSSRSYGDPWQLVYVFDSDPTTNVVCEGYSKAFQYLCSKSQWHDPSVACISVYGDMIGGTGAGRHMWNIVSLGGANYLADITNSDNGTAGSDGSLFLKAYSSGDIYDGYSFTYGSGKTITYAYDSDVNEVYSESDRTLSAVDLNPDEYQAEHGHAWGEGTVISDGSCTEPSERAFTCGICGLTKTETVDSGGHTLTYTAAVDPACDTTGNTGYWTCTACGRHFSDEEGRNEIEENSWVIPAVGHSPVKHDAVAATCTEDGRREYYSCEVCGRIFEDADCEAETSMDALTVKALGHDWAFVDFTWTELGADARYGATANYRCLRDESHVGYVDIDVTASENSATCLVPGSIVYTAEVNGGNSLDGASHSESRTVEGEYAVHKLTKTDAVAPTCEAAGNREYWSCDVCGKHFSDEAGRAETAEGSWIIPARRHAWEFAGFTWTENGEEYQATADYVCKNDPSHTQSIEAVVTKVEDENKSLYKASIGVGNELDGMAHHDEKVVGDSHVHMMIRFDAAAPTCEESGCQEHWYCIGCGKYFQDEEGRTQIEENSWVISATGHDWDDGTVTKAAGCTAPGVRKYTCRNDHSHTYTESIEALGHDWMTIVYSRPTCTMSGRSISVCKRSRYHIITNVIPATGHEWDDGVVTKEPTETRDGVRTYTCKHNHRHTRTEAIPAVGVSSRTETNYGTVSENKTNSSAVDSPWFSRIRNVWRRWTNYMCALQ